MTSIDEIKKLRDETGLSITQCKDALENCDNNFNKAVEFLRKKGSLVAEKKSSRSLGSGYIGVYVHNNGQVAAVVELLCETDFVSKNKEFIQVANDLAMHVTAMTPLYISREDIEEDTLSNLKQELKEGIAESKSSDIQDKIIEGQLDARLSESVLLEQKFLKDDSKTIKEIVESCVHKFGERIEIGQFKRFSIK